MEHWWCCLFRWLCPMDKISHYMTDGLLWCLSTRLEGVMSTVCFKPIPLGSYRIHYVWISVWYMSLHICLICLLGKCAGEYSNQPQPPRNRVTKPPKNLIILAILDRLATGFPREKKDPPRNQKVQPGKLRCWTQHLKVWFRWFSFSNWLIFCFRSFSGV